MSRAAFHAAIAASLFKGSLPDWQRGPVDAILDEGIARGRRLPEVAYVLATAWWETGRFRHMEEIGRGEGRDYGEAVLLIRGKRLSYHGRGFVQLTWLANYARMSLILGVDLVNEPERATEPAIAARILWEGMIRGSFTGESLADYFAEGEARYVEARKIVNGTDKAEVIAEAAERFAEALALLGETPPAPACPLGRAGCPLAAA